MSTQHSLEQRFSELWPADQWRAVGVLVAVSGGPDSVALLRAMRVLGGDSAGLHVAHLNHGLRGDAAAADESFVQELSRELGVPCHVGHADVGAAALRARESVETTAREARYDFLQRTAEALGTRYVVTGHTADDQVETIVHRIVRGTGLAGLSGMQRARPLGPATTLLRPMLTLRRAELITYLHDLGQEYREDATNSDPRFMRSRIRHELLPLLRENYNSGVDGALLRLARLATDLRRFSEPLAAQLLETCIKEQSEKSIHLDCDKLRDADPFLVRDMLVHLWVAQGWPQQEMGFDEWEQLRAMAQNALESGASQRCLPGGIMAQRVAGTLILKPSPA